jgi:outer membrane biosynthesis protein TonB
LALRVFYLIGFHQFIVSGLQIKREKAMKTMKTMSKAMAVLLALILAFNTWPPMPLAAQNGNPPTPMPEIIAFEPLAEEVAEQAVPYGTGLFNLPETLIATVRYINPTTETIEPYDPEKQDESESKKYDGEPGQEEPAQEESKQEEPGLEEPKQEEPKQEEPKQEEPKQEEPKQEEPGLEGTAGSVDGLTTGLPSDAEPQASIRPLGRLANTVPFNYLLDFFYPDEYNSQPKYNDTETQIPVIWEASPPFDAHTPGIYIFMPLIIGEFTVAAEAPVITVTVMNEILSDVIFISAFKELDEEILWQEYALDEVIDQDGLLLPNMLAGFDEDGNPVDIYDVEWESTPDFDSFVPGFYYFEPVFSDRYIIKDDAVVPLIFVYIEDDGFGAVSARGFGGLVSFANASFSPPPGGVREVAAGAYHTVNGD